jgi:hypothetical protein
MTAFYNRDPWNLIIGFGLLAALLYGIAVVISPWVVAVIFAFVAVSMLRRRLIRWDDLR